MTRILHLDSSPRGNRSHSRNLAKTFIKAWQELHPEDRVTYRDLREASIPHVTEEWIAADFTSPEERTPEMTAEIKFSDELVDEFLAVDRCIYSVPMYNFNVPSNFKAYIDQLVRVGRTFTFEGNQPKGLVEGKKVLFITTRGAEYSENSPFAGCDFQVPFLRAIFQFVGVKDIQFINADGLDLGEEARQRGLSEAQAEIQKVVLAW